MANEITGTIQLRLNNGALQNNKSLSFSADQALARSDFENIQNIPTTAAGTALVFGAGVTTFGQAYFYNLDAANYVEIGVQVAGTFYPLVRLKGGAVNKKEAALFRLSPGITVYARANTAPVDLEFGVLND